MIILCSPRSYYKKRKVRKQITEYSISDNLKYRKIKERKELKGKKKEEKKSEEQSQVVKSHTDIAIQARTTEKKEKEKLDAVLSI